MSAAPRRWAAELLHFWFSELRPNDWFGGGEKVDAALRRRFARELAMLSARRPGEFLRDRRTAQAAILLFDQVPRNLFRDTPRAYACDPLGRAIALSMIARKWDRSLSLAERQFVYMPLMHSERIIDQLLSLRLFHALGTGYGLPFARSHYRMVARFGRFPHRNAVLGRSSTAAERRAIAAGNAW